MGKLTKMTGRIGLGLLLCLSFSYAQIPDFTKLTVEEGLSHNVSRRLIQDKQGFIWIATQSGLNRFDGYAFQSYLHKRQDPNSLSDDDIRALIVARDGRLLIGTAKGGLNIYHPVCDCFTSCLHDPEDSLTVSSNFIFDIFEDKDGQIWVGTNRGLDKLIFQGEKAVFQHYTSRKGDKTSLPANGANAMEHDQYGQHWFASLSYGLSRLEKDQSPGQQEVFTQFHPTVGGSTTPINGAITSLYIDRRGDLWIGGENLLNRIPAAELQKAQPDFIRYDLRDFPGYEPERFSILNMKEDAQGGLWFMDFYAYHRYWPEADSFETFDLRPLLVTERSNNVLYDILFDHQGNIWLATVEGIYMPRGSKDAFHMILFPDQQVRACWDIFEDRYGYLWVGTESDGLWVFDQEKRWVQTFSTSSADPAQRLARDFISEIFEDRAGNIWLGLFFTHSAVIQLKRTSTGEIIQARVKGIEDVLHYACNYASQDEQGNIWLFLHRHIQILDEHTFKVKRTFNEIPVNEAARDAQGKMWLATDKGLAYYEAAADSIIFVDASPELPLHQKIRMIFDIEIEPSAHMWLGSIRGLGYYEPETHKFQLFREEDGLIGNQVHNIQRDAHGKLWLGTHKGLSLFEPRTKQFLNFDRKDGIGVRGFNRRASWQDRKGNIYMGGDQGTLYFHPDSVRRNPLSPQVYITDFRIFNEKVPIQFADSSIGMHDFILPRPISQMQEIRLPYRYRMLSFDYVALNYLLPEKNQYAYMMEGFDESWIQAGKTRSATYTNLSPGTYTFRVKASNNDGVWNEKGTSLKIVIDPPWYRSWWAFVLYGTLISSVLGLFLYARVRKVAREYETQARIERAKVEERESVRQRSSRDFHDEAGNKLTKLSLYTELGKRKAADDPDMLSYLGHIESNVRELATGMRDFIWVLDPEKDTLADTLSRLKDFGNQLFAHSDTAFTYKMNMDDFRDQPLDIKDKRHLLLIFKEAMNNCLKYAQADHAVLEASLHQNQMSVSFEDDGKGFDPENAEKGNGLKNMRSRAAEMGGRMSYRSAPDQGTRITFEMQITRMGEER